MDDDWDRRALDVLRAWPGRVVVLLDGDYVVRWVNDTALDVLGRPASEVIGRPGLEFVHADDLAASLEEQARMLEEHHLDHRNASLGIDGSARLRVLRADGGAEWIEWTIVNLFGTYLGTLGLVGRRVQDLARFDLAVERLGAGAPIDDVLGALVEHLRSAFSTQHAWIVRWGRREPSVTGGSLPFDLRRLRGLRPGDGLVRLHDVRFDDGATAHLAPITMPGTVTVVAAVVVPVQHRLSMSGQELVGNVARLAGVAIAVHEQADQLRRAAGVDPLTGLANRRQFDEWVRSLAGACSVVAVDLDEFKPVNDRFGHGAGDEVLVEVAERIRSVVRVDDLVARLGGDEFAVLCPGLASAEGVEGLCGRLDDAMTVPFTVEGHEVVVRASAGGSVRQGDEPLTETLRRADAACYVVKRRRRPPA